ncbi:Xylose isomerase-like TIM barrel [Maioricimonas rarisocia]|uniref:Xylose isomerase-like TIM barrel n=1 Tax=Maioricimonas rarisocia TaxID=2528026 RepID=A0A517Z9P0_9PLAN|nr:TIM barrel protein [Maioricimonas rarisocia]QDU39183.1 Xylose isomerase-like TIM barrel [Maioricimonas rarisocia]
MQTLKIAVATAPFQQPIRQAVQTAAATGASGLQIDARNELKPSELSETGRRQFLHMLSEMQLSVASVTFPLRRPLQEREALDARIAALKQAMEFAFQLKARVLTTRLSDLPDDPDSRDAVTLQEILEDLSRHANHVGVKLAIASGSHDTQALSGLIERSSQGPLGIDFDPASAVMGRRDPAQVLRDLHRHVMHFQIRDALRQVDGPGKEVAVGRGEVSWEEMLAMIDDMNYTGWLTVRRSEGDERAGDSARAVTYLKNVALG